MRLWIAPLARSRRAVPNGGPHLSVAYDLTCFITLFCLYKVCLKNCMTDAVDSTINQISSISFVWWSAFVCSLLVAL